MAVRNPEANNSTVKALCSAVYNGDHSVAGSTALGGVGMKAKLRVHALVCGCLLLCGIGLMCNKALATTILDQSVNGPVTAVFSAGDTSNGESNLAQTFTVGITGQLTSVKIALENYQGNATGTLKVELLNTISGAPGTSVLATGSIN
jgi:hypothetical protein